MADTHWGLPSGQAGNPPPARGPATQGELSDFAATLVVATDVHPVAVALDAARLAADPPAAERATALLADLLRLLPADCHLDAYVLGSLQRIAPTQLVAAGPAAATGGVGLLHPVLRAFETDARLLPGARLVVLGAGPIYDLPDLAGDPALDRIILCHCGGASLVPPGFDPESVESVEATVEAVLARIGSATACVRLAGPGLAPYRWDNDRFELTVAEGRLCLQTPSALPAAGLSVSLSFLGPSAGATLTAEVAYSDGETARHELVGTAVAAPAWSDGLVYRDRLVGDELAAFGCIAAGMRFICPVCGATHAPTETVCRITSRAGVPVFRCLAGPPGQMLVFRTTETREVEVYSAPGPVLRVASHTLVVCRPTPCVLSFDPEAGVWRCRDLVNYERIGAVHVVAPCGSVA